MSNPTEGTETPRPRDFRRDAVLTDGPTGLPNQRHFDVVYSVAFWFGHRGIPVSLLLVSIPGLGDVPEGLARELGGEVSDRSRRTDLVARIDHDRLALLLLDCNVHGGLVAADRFHPGIERWAERAGVRFHVGLAAFQHDMATPDLLVEAAEAALERSAASGESGRIEVEDGSSPERS